MVRSTVCSDFLIYQNLMKWNNAAESGKHKKQPNGKLSTKIKRTPPKENGNQQGRICIKVTVLRQLQDLDLYPTANRISNCIFIS